MLKINIHLVQYLADNNLLRNYAVWLRLKHIHINGRVYDYSVNKMAAQAGLSRNGIRKYMAFFAAEGWIRKEGNDIIFISTANLKKACGISLKWDCKVKCARNINTMIQQLRYELLKEKQRKFNYIKKLSNNRNNPTGKNALAKYKKAKKFIPAGEIADQLKIRLTSLSKIVNVSASTVSRLIKIYQKKGKATIIRGKKTIAKNIWRTVELPTNTYWYKGFIVKVECNKYVFL